MADTQWDSGHLLAACQGRSVTIWNPYSQSGTPVQLPSSSEVTGVQWTQNGKVLVVVNASGVVDFYNQGQSMGSLPDAAQTKVQMGAITCVRLSRDTKRAYLGSADGALYAWDLKRQILTGTLQHAASISSVALDEERVAVASADGSLAIYSQAGLQQLVSLAQPGGPRKETHSCLSFSPLEAGVLGAATSPDHIIELWSVKGSRPQNMRLSAGKHTQSITGVLFSPVNTSQLFSCGLDGKLNIWDRRTNTVAQSLTQPLPITCMSVREDGVAIAAGTHDGSVLLHDARKLHGQSGRLQGPEPLPIVELHWQPPIKHHRSSTTNTPAAAAGTATAGAAGVEAAGGARGSGDGTAQRQGSGSLAQKTSLTNGTDPSRAARRSSIPSAAAPTTPPTITPVGATGVAGAPARVSASSETPTAATAGHAAAVIQAQGTADDLPASNGLLTNGVQGAAGLQGQARGRGSTAGVVGGVAGGMLAAIKAQAAAAQAERMSESGEGFGGAYGSPTGTPGAMAVPASSSRGALLGESTFRTALDHVVDTLRDDIRNLHVEVIRQHHMQQSDMVDLIAGVVARQGALTQEVRALKAQLDRIARQQSLTSLF